MLLESIQHLEKLKDVVVTEKLDGENTRLYRGKWNEQKIRACWRGASFYGEEQEGCVVGHAASFSYVDFKYNVTKYARASHVRTTKHWKRGTIISNQLAKG
ncbi:MAG: RNA ligase family protein [candidate division KSB1 bacterium]|nr:RNA ligase family protein [candidate division KSB1 bacterium]MDZ7367969.1 RNA ligase family protein [candidate division KSB1 bacterium]MDZ7405592.1 RNA ligase family protein [candidate division KSB1 bacterium]